MSDLLPAKPENKILAALKAFIGQFENEEPAGLTPAAEQPDSAALPDDTPPVETPEQEAVADPAADPAAEIAGDAGDGTPEDAAAGAAAGAATEAEQDADTLPEGDVSADALRDQLNEAYALIESYKIRIAELGGDDAALDLDEPEIVDDPEVDDDEYDADADVAQQLAEIEAIRTPSRE